MAATCRRGGCGKQAAEGSEWCEEHGWEVRKRQLVAAGTPKPKAYHKGGAAVGKGG